MIHYVLQFRNGAIVPEMCNLQGSHGRSGKEIKRQKLGWEHTPL